MSNTYTDRLKRLVAPGDMDWDDEMHDNEKIDEFIAGGLLSKNRVISGGLASIGSGLDVDYESMVVEVGGVSYEIAAGSVTTIPGSLNFVYVNSAGVVTMSTNLPSGDYIPLAVADAGAAAIDRVGETRPMATGRNLIVDPPTGVELTGGISGLVLSNNVTDSSNDIDVSAGACMDSTGLQNLSLPATIVKQIDAAWAVGTNAGGLLNGSVAISKLYHIYALRKDSDGSVDVGFLLDGDAIATYLPAGYSYYRWIGFVVTDGTSNIRGFVQSEDSLEFDTSFEIIASINSAALAVQDVSASVPSGKTKNIMVRASAGNITLAANTTEASQASSDYDLFFVRVLVTGGNIYAADGGFGRGVKLKQVEIIR